MILEKGKKAYKFKKNHIFLLVFIFLISSYAMINFNVIKGIRPLVRNIEERVVLYKTDSFNEIETKNFIFRYEETDKEILNLIMNITEEKYEELINIYEYRFKDKILVVIYEDSDLMMNTTMLKKGYPPMGVYYGNSIHILDPNLWVEDSDNVYDEFYNEGPVLHELTHLFTDHSGNGNFPMWFTEGVSLYFEYMIDGYEWGEEVGFKEEEYKIEDLNNNFKNLDQYKAYTKSFRIVKAFVDENGLDSLLDIIVDLGNGHSFNQYIYLFEEI